MPPDIEWTDVLASFDVVYALRPRLALLWRLDDESSYRRWTADSTAPPPGSP